MLISIQLQLIFGAIFNGCVRVRERRQITRRHGYQLVFRNPRFLAVPVAVDVQVKVLSSITFDIADSLHVAFVPRDNISDGGFFLEL